MAPVKQTSGKRKVGDGTPGPGRPKGSQNKATKALKDMILNALERAGGEDYLKRQATANPTAFLTLVGKVLPMQVQAEHSGPGGDAIQTKLDLSNLTEAQLEALASIRR